MTAPLVLFGEEWMLVGRSAGNSLLVRGGDKPIVIRVSHTDSSDLLSLLESANIGIRAVDAKVELPPAQRSTRP